MSFEGSPMLSALEKQPAPEFTLDSLKGTAEGDELLEDMYEDVNKCAHRYFDSVLSHERVAHIQKMRIPAEEYRELHERLDHARRITHNSLCDKLRILARAENKSGRDIKWWIDIAGPRENRSAIGQWTLRSVFNELRENEGQHDE